MDYFADSFVATHVPLGTIAVRLLAAALLGAVIGLEREWRHRPAGLRTHMLTALAAAVFTILTAEILHSDLLGSQASEADPIRVIEAVTSGVAFLAAGAIIQSRGRVQGLTTGAGMWLAGSLGVAAGLGQILVGLVAAILGFVVIALLRAMEFGDRKEREGGDI